jgi:preprotein translocase subunit SecG
MENVVLTIHLILALALVGVVLLQRSEGGGLGIGGGGGVVSGRSAATALGKITWLLAIGFICTSIALTVLARREAASSSVIDAATPAGTTAPASAAPGSSLLPPGTSDQPLTPPRVD